MQNLHVFWKLYTLKSRLLFWKLKNMKFIVCQNLLHDIKIICILRLQYKGEYIPRAWRQLKAKAYCPISLLQKIVKKLMNRNIKGENIGVCPLYL